MRSLYLAAALCVAFQLAEATTYNSNGTQADVQAKVNLCVDGDTVTLPVGTFTYRAGSIYPQIAIDVTKAIKIIGAGIDQTIIIDEVPRVGGNGTVFVLAPTSTTALSDFSGMTIRGGTSVTSNTDTFGAIHIDAVSTVPNVRVHHIKMDSIYGRNFTVTGSVLGVIDHCTFIRGAGRWNGCFDIHHNSWKGVGNMGDNSWADGTNLGTEKALYIEDCSLSGYDGATCVDSMGGSRIVFRHNAVTASVFGNHGTDTSQRYRSARSFEVYSNNFTASARGQDKARAVYLRGGTGVVYNNTFTGYDNGVVMAAYRVWMVADPWGGADGLGLWDSNDTTNHTGNGFGGGPGGLYASGTYTGANGATALVKTGAGWPTNQWVGYALRNTSRHHQANILSSTSDTIQYESDSQGPKMSFNTGDTWEIRKVLITIDQVGRGKGDYLSGSSPTPTGWPHEALEPVYIWGNTFNGGSINRFCYAQSDVIQANRDYIFDTPKPGYTPYTYPHPLVGEAVDAPQNLRVSP